MPVTGRVGRAVAAGAGGADAEGVLVDVGAVLVNAGAGAVVVGGAEVVVVVGTGAAVAAASTVIVPCMNGWIVQT
jgi:hypothetical protein